MAVEVEQGRTKPERQRYVAHTAALRAFEIAATRPVLVYVEVARKVARGETAAD